MKSLLRRMLIVFALMPAVGGVAQTYVTEIEDGHYYYINTKQNVGSLIWPSTTTDASGNPYLSDYAQKEWLNYTDKHVTTPIDLDYTYCLWQFKKRRVNGYDVWQIVNVAHDRYMVWINMGATGTPLHLEKDPSADANTYFVVVRKTGDEFCIFPIDVATGTQGSASFDVKGGAKGDWKLCESDPGWHLVQFYGTTSLRFEEETAYQSGLAIHVADDYTVSLACSTEGAEVYYTTDGSNPATSATRVLYGGSFNLGHNTEVVRAVSVKGGEVSREETYYATPYYAPAMYIDGTTVTLASVQAGAHIYYTTDGTTPTLNDNGEPSGSTLRYTAPIVVDFSNTSTPVVVRAVVANRGRGDMSAEQRLENTFLITRSSQITDMKGRYLFGSGFVVDKTDIGTDESPFEGSIDGLRQPIDAIAAPLFGSTKDADIRGVVFKQATVSGSGTVGALVRKAKGRTRIYNCGVLGGSVSSSDGNCGSLVGSLEDYARVVNCYSFATIGGGTTVGGIVGNNTATTTAQDMRTLVANCVFYGAIEGGTSRYPVYGGTLISNNNGVNSLNLYNYYRDEAIDPTKLKDFNCAWPVEEVLLVRYEHLRSLLNSNRQLMAWYLTGSMADTALIDKWVLDPEVASYPALKRWGRYPSLVNLDSKCVWNAGSWKPRAEANPWEGKQLGTLEVKVNSGTSMSTTLHLPITDMDTLGGDYCYAKVQLPYYNTLFGNPDSRDWNTRFGGNYTDRVVTGWEVIATDHEGKHSFVKDWQDGYNFADRECTEKDLYAKSGRVFAQGGYYYVPRGVKQIEITAHWANAVYLHNANHVVDLVNEASTAPNFGAYHDKTFGGRPVFTTIAEAIGAMERTSINSSVTVYDQAIVLVGNYQWCNKRREDLGRDADRPFTITSVDLDMDEEPDYCFEAQWGQGADRITINPIRFDFLAVPPLGLAMKQYGKTYRLNTGIALPRGHFEITETSFIHFTEFEYDRRTFTGSDKIQTDKAEAPLILNGGYIHRIITSESGVVGNTTDRTLYIVMGGRFGCHAFTPGPHNDRNYYKNRHCAVSVLGGEFPEFYLSGKYVGEKADANKDNPHCYVDGGYFGTLAGAGMEKIDGNVTLEIEHSLIGELYGGGMNADAPITGSIKVTVNHSIVGKYCGGPKYGNMNSGTSITTLATGTRFGSFFGGGDGGTNLALNSTYDNKAQSCITTTPELEKWELKGAKDFPVGGEYVNEKAKDSYYAQFAFDCYNISSGTESNNHNMRTYKYTASFAKTEVDAITSELDSCEVMGDFYGAGNLGAVRANVTSTLNNTTVHGSAFGAGFSATIPTFKVYSRNGLKTPYRDAKTGICHSEEMGDILTYTWSDGSDGSGVSASYRNSNPGLDPKVELSYFYTSPDNLKDLGQVGGNVVITITGSSLVQGSVFGGGNESAVAGNTEVNLSGKAQVEGNVYGGGNLGLVKGNSNVYLLNK